MKKIELKVRKVKTTEVDGKPDTYTVLLEGSAAPGVDVALTVSAEDYTELEKFVTARPGVIMEVTLAPAMYGNIESYGYTEVKKILAETGFSSENIEEALAMQADPYPTLAGPERDKLNQDLEARRRAYEASQKQEELDESEEPDLEKNAL